MAVKSNRIAAAVSLVAALSLAAIPANAAELPRNSAITPGKVYDADAENAANHRWGGYPYGYRYRRGPRSGDVIAGILVLGTIAAIASSAQKNRERSEPYPDRYPNRYPRPDERDYRTPRGDRYESGGIGRAVDMCLDEVERMRGRVDRVENASRRGDGWHVSGQLEGGDAFTCRIDNDGRVSDVQLGRDAFEGADASGAIAPQGQQWNDEAYAEARRETSASVSATASAQEPAPAYPGGLYEGENGAEDDGRYSLSEAPDFTES
jgi:hypothetical protein